MSVTVSTGGASWKAEMSSEAQSWITTASEEDVLTVKVEPNTAQEPRTETIQQMLKSVYGKGCVGESLARNSNGNTSFMIILLILYV